MICWSSPPGSDVARLFAKSSYRSRMPSEIVHTGSCARTHKQRCTRLQAAPAACVLTSLPGDGGTDQSIVILAWSILMHPMPLCKCNGSYVM